MEVSIDINLFIRGKLWHINTCRTYLEVKTMYDIATRNIKMIWGGAINIIEDFVRSRQLKWEITTVRVQYNHMEIFSIPPHNNDRLSQNTTSRLYQPTKQNGSGVLMNPHSASYKGKKLKNRPSRIPRSP